MSDVRYSLWGLTFFWLEIEAEGLSTHPSDGGIRIHRDDKFSPLLSIIYINRNGEFLSSDELDVFIESIESSTMDISINPLWFNLNPFISQR
jgi:hypothetical protein